MNLREWALPVYTILMQIASGTLFVLWIIRSSNLRRVEAATIDRILRRPVLVVFLTVLVANIGSHFHLSRPLQSFLAIINLGNSWLSREILFSVLLLLTCAALADQVWKIGEHPRRKTFLGWIAVLLGGAVIFSMATIYLLPTQAPWNNVFTILLFYGSTLLMGACSALALLVMDAIFAEPFEPDVVSVRRNILQRSLRWITILVAATVVAITALNLIQIQIMRSDELSKTSLALLLGLYRPLLGIRFLFLFAGIGSLLLTNVWLLKKGRALAELVAPVYLVCLLELVSEILGRFLFYAIHVRLGI